jgi:hypothetical protein
VSSLLFELAMIHVTRLLHRFPINLLEGVRPIFAAAELLTKVLTITLQGPPPLHITHSLPKLFTPSTTSGISSTMVFMTSLIIKPQAFDSWD